MGTSLHYGSSGGNGLMRWVSEIADRNRTGDDVSGTPGLKLLEEGSLKHRREYAGRTADEAVRQAGLG